MEDLIAQFTILSNQALADKSFNPSKIEDLMSLFEHESHEAWKSNEFDLFNELSQAEFSLHEAEDYLDSVMESAMDEFGKFEIEFDRMGMDELQSLDVSATERYDEAVAAAKVKSGKKKVRPD